MESYHHHQRPEGPDTAPQVTEEPIGLSRDLAVTEMRHATLSPQKQKELGTRLEAVRQRIAEVDLDLQRQGFDPPGTDLDAWLHLARIIEVDPSQMTAAELYEEALAWVDRMRIQEQIRQRVRQKTLRLPKQLSSSSKPQVPRENTGFGFVGHRDWENWGLGLDVDQGWHLFHFQRRDGQWVRHQHCALRIPGGLPGSLAQAFVTGRGERAAVKLRPHQETTSSSASHDRARATCTGDRHDAEASHEARLSASTACWAALLRRQSHRRT